MQQIIPHLLCFVKGNKIIRVIKKDCFYCTTKFTCNSKNVIYVYKKKWFLSNGLRRRTCRFYFLSCYTWSTFLLLNLLQSMKWMVRVCHIKKNRSILNFEYMCVKLLTILYFVLLLKLPIFYYKLRNVWKIWIYSTVRRFFI